MNTLKTSKAPAIPVLCALGIAAATLWIGGQSQAASPVPSMARVETNSMIVQDSCVDSALRLKLMIHRSGLIPNASPGGNGSGCGAEGLSGTEVESLHSAIATPDLNPMKTSPDGEKS